MMISVELYIAILLSLSLVAWVDFKTKKISNYWSILNLIVFVGLMIFSPDHIFHWSHFLYPVILLSTGFMLFTIKIMGAGDAKFLFTLVLIIPSEWHQRFVEQLILSTCLIGFMLLLVNSFRSRVRLISEVKLKGIRGLSGCLGTRFSYAPVILFAWIWLALKYKILN